MYSKAPSSDSGPLLYTDTDVHLWYKPCAVLLDRCITIQEIDIQDLVLLRDFATYTPLLNPVERCYNPRGVMPS